MTALGELKRENERADALIEKLQQDVAALTDRLAKLESTAERATPLRASAKLFWRVS